MSEEKKYEKNVGMIGLGYWGKNILRNLYELGVLHTACDLSSEIIEQRKKDYPDVEYTGDFQSILNNESIKAVVIAAPAASHYQLVKEALLAGKDVFVEKPLALSTDHGAELVELAKKLGKVLMVGHILQYHSAVIKLKQMIDDGELGRIQYIYSNRLNMGKLRVEENILWSFAPHDISIILMLLGEEPVDVTCFGEDFLNEHVHDVTMTTLTFKDKVKAHIFVSWLHPFKEQKLVVVGSKAMAVFDDQSQEKLCIYPHKVEWRNGTIPVAQKADHYVVEIEKNEPLKEEMRHFLEATQTRKNPKTDGEEGLRVLKVLEKADNHVRGKQNKEVAGNYFAHETAVVDDNVCIGKGSKVWHYSHVLSNTIIGEKVVLGQNVSVGPDVRVGNNCKIQNNVSVYKGVELEDDVFCGPSCVFTNVYNPRAFVERKDEFRKTLVKKGATIGANATIVCGVTLGEYSLIGAGAVVKGDVEPYTVVAGVPAKAIGYVCACGEKISFENDQAKCSRCSDDYKLVGGKVKAAS